MFVIMTIGWITDTITSGSNFNSKTFYVLKNKINLIKNKNLKKLLLIAKKWNN